MVRDKRINWGVAGHREVMTHLIVFNYLQLSYITMRLFPLKMYYFDCDANVIYFIRNISNLLIIYQFY